MEENKDRCSRSRQLLWPFHTAACEWLPNNPGIILETTKIMHFSKYVIIFTVEISSDIALSVYGNPDFAFHGESGLELAAFFFFFLLCFLCFFFFFVFSVVFSLSSLLFFFFARTSSI